MNLPRLIVLAFWLLLVAPSLARADPAGTFAQEVSANAHPLILAEGVLSGQGADLIRRESRKAHFLMVGEQHATAGIAYVNLGLHRIAAEADYRHAALEIGPHSTVALEKLVRAEDGNLAQFIRSPGNGFVFPFVGWAEEAALVEQMIDLSPAPAPVLWGIDQEFVGSAAIHLARLRSAARSPHQQMLLAEFERRAAKDPHLVATLEAADYDRLRAAFPAQEHKQELALIEDLAASAAIYAPFLGRGGSPQSANHARETYMKQRFLDHFGRAEAASGKPQKVFFKFGANHATRGHSLSDVPALGNFLAEWGLARGLRMVNVLVDCVGGQQSDVRTGQLRNCTSYFDLPPDSPFRTSAAASNMTLFDLRPLRGRMPKDLDATTKKLILGFDFYIPVASPAAATPIAPVPAISSR